MGNEMDRSDRYSVDSLDDADSAVALGPGDLSMSASGGEARGHTNAADSRRRGGGNNNNNTNTNTNTNNNNRLYNNNTSYDEDADSAVAVGPYLSFQKTTSTSASRTTTSKQKSASVVNASVSASATSTASASMLASASTSTSVNDESEFYPGMSHRRTNSSMSMPSTVVPTSSTSLLLRPLSPTWTYESSVLSSKDSALTNGYAGPTSMNMNSNTNANANLAAAHKSPSSPSRRQQQQQPQPDNKKESSVDVGHELDIEEGTPAAEALKANAQVKVTKVSKAARFMHAQTIKKVIHKGTIWKKPGNKRGKPPRVPDLVRRWSDGDIQIDTVREVLTQINEESEGEESEIGVTSTRSNSRVQMLESLTLSSRDFKELPKTGEEEDPDEIQVAYDSTKFDPPTLVLHDKHGKKQEIKMFGKIKDMSSKRKEMRESRNYVKGKVIEKEHELYTLSIAVMLGLRYAIYQTHIQLENDKKDKRFWLDSEEFMRMEKYVFRPDGRKNTPPHKLGHTFKFKDYSPVPFAYIRRMFGINEYEFIHSVCGNANFIEFISNAKSGQFFFYSSDGKYMIKTMTNTESKFLRRILPHYFRHCAQNPSTLMTKFLGMYRVKLYHLQRNVKFIVMNSVFDTDKMISSFYDLKGSKLGRDAKPGESVKKDNDVRRMIEKDPNNGFILPPSVRTRLRDQVVRDCNFLNEMKIMDYSMLIGVHYSQSTRGKSGDSIDGLVFRDSESVRSGRRSIKSSNKPNLRSQLERARSEGGVSSPYNSAKFTRNSLVTPKQTNTSPLLDVKRSADSKKVEFHLDGDILPNELLEEKPSNISFLPRPLSPFNLDELGSKILMSGDQSVVSTSTLGFDEDEESFSSRLNLPVREDILNSPVISDDNSNLEWRRERVDVDIRREVAIEQSYWPFHRYYEINGQRRVIPINDRYRADVTENEATTDTVEVNCTSCLGNPNDFDPDLAAAREKWQMKDFERPISNRKDGGLAMDLTGVTLPMKVVSGKQKQDCDGKIFYMGIIDILQQFNVRKRMEAKYRRIKGAGWDGASCVHPEFYAERFIRFFDEYTQRQMSSNPTDTAGSEEEEISFSRNGEGEAS